MSLLEVYGSVFGFENIKVTLNGMYGNIKRSGFPQSLVKVLQRIFLILSLKFSI